MYKEEDFESDSEAHREPMEGGQNGGRVLLLVCSSHKASSSALDKLEMQMGGFMHIYTKQC